MKTKVFQSPIELKVDGNEGDFRAVFSLFDVIDHDGDVTLAGAFQDGQKVRISYWGHRWEDLPVGVGEIYSDDEKAWVDGSFFMDTQAGMETYKTVKNLGDLQEWSYGFEIIDSETGERDGKSVRFLKALDVIEVSPVLLGAGIGTHTELIKNKKDDEVTTEDVHEVEDQIGNDVSSGGGLSAEDYKTIFEDLFQFGG